MDFAYYCEVYAWIEYFAKMTRATTNNCILDFVAILILKTPLE